MEHRKIAKEHAYEMFYYLRLYTECIEPYAGQYNYNSNRLNDFLNKNKIELKKVTKSKSVKELPKSNYIVFVYGDRKGYDDKAHDLLRRIRNAIAHGRIGKTSNKKVVFDLTDRNKSGSLTMRGKIDADLFFVLIQQLINTKNDKE